MDMTPESLKEILAYDRELGELRWKVDRPKIRAGSIATRRGPKGTLVVPYQGNKLYAHRVAWALEHGHDAIGHVLPINGDFADIRIANLKEQARSDTLASAKERKTNSSGHKGVSRSSQSGRWIASITRNYRRYYLGEFDTKQEAAAAYAFAASGNLPEEKAQQLPRKPKEERRRRWIGQKAAQAMPLLAGFDSYQAIVDEAGLPPSEKHVLMRKDLNQSLGPKNAEWRMPYNEGGKKIRYHHAHLGATNDDFDRFLTWQNGCCAICGKPETQTFGGVAKALALDHDPTVGVVRGLLCTACNTALGLFREDPELLRNALEYVESCGVVPGDTFEFCASCKQHVPDDARHTLALNYMGEPLGLLCEHCGSNGKFIKYQRALYRQHVKRMGWKENCAEWPPGPDTKVA